MRNKLDFSKVTNWEDIKIPRNFTRNNTVYPPVDDILKDRKKYSKETLGDKYGKFATYAGFVANLVEVLYDFLDNNKGVEKPSDRYGDNDYIYAAIRHQKEIDKQNFPAFQQPSKPIRRSWIINPEEQPDLIRKYGRVQLIMKGNPTILPSFNKVISDALVMFFVKVFNGWHGIEVESLVTDEGNLKFVQIDAPVVAEEVKEQQPERSIQQRLKSIVRKKKAEEKVELKESDVELLLNNINTFIDTVVVDNELNAIIKKYFFSTAPAADLKQVLYDFKLSNYHSYRYMINILKEVLPNLGATLSSKYVSNNFEKALYELRKDNGRLSQPEKVLLMDLVTGIPIKAKVGFAYRDYREDIPAVKAILKEFYKVDVEVESQAITKDTEEMEILNELNEAE